MEKMMYFSIFVLDMTLKGLFIMSN